MEDRLQNGWFRQQGNSVTEISDREAFILANTQLMLPPLSLIHI